MKVVRRHNFEELTPTLLREFVEKIVVHECNRLLKQYNEMYCQHCLKQLPYQQGINNFVSVSVQLH